MKNLLQLVYDVSIKNCELMYDLIGVVNITSELKRMKGKPIWRKPFIMEDGIHLICGLQQVKNGILMYKTTKGSLLPIQRYYRQCRIQLKNNILSFVEETKDHNIVLFDGQLYDLNDHSLEFFEKLVILKRLQYPEKYILLLNGVAIASKSRISPNDNLQGTHLKTISNLCVD